MLLSGPLEDEIYLGQPPNFVVRNQKLKFYKLKKALYGLKQAPRAFNKRIDGFLKDVGFKKCVSEHEVYVKTITNKGVIILCLYINDFLITGNNKMCIYKFKDELMKEFEMTGIGLMTYFLGIELHKSKRKLLMQQRRYALKILKKLEMEHCNDAITPAEPRLQLFKNEDEQDVDPTQYRRLIKSLRYLCNMRSDLAFSIGIVSRFMGRSKVSHLEADKKILRYVKCFIDCEILFPVEVTSRKCNLLDFTDFNW